MSTPAKAPPSLSTSLGELAARLERERAEARDRLALAGARGEAPRDADVLGAALDPDALEEVERAAARYVEARRLAPRVADEMRLLRERDRVFAEVERERAALEAELASMRVPGTGLVVRSRWLEAEQIKLKLRELHGRSRAASRAHAEALVDASKFWHLAPAELRAEHDELKRAVCAASSEFEAGQADLDDARTGRTRTRLGVDLAEAKRWLEVSDDRRSGSALALARQVAELEAKLEALPSAKSAEKAATARIKAAEQAAEQAERLRARLLERVQAFAK